MAYTKTTWANGDTITAEKLNNLETGVTNVSGSYVTSNGSYIDKSYNQLVACLQNGVVPICIKNSNGTNNVCPLINYHYGSGTYYAQFNVGNVYVNCYCSDATSNMVVD